MFVEKRKKPKCWLNELSHIMTFLRIVLGKTFMKLRMKAKLKNFKKMLVKMIKDCQMTLILKVIIRRQTGIQFFKILI